MLFNISFLNHDFLYTHTLFSWPSDSCISPPPFFLTSIHSLLTGVYSYPLELYFPPSLVLTLNNPWWCTTPSWSFSKLSREYSVCSNIFPCLPSWLSLLGFSRVRIYKTHSNLAKYSITFHLHNNLVNYLGILYKLVQSE